MNGKLIVIDGSDGTGKATQTELLKKRLQLQGVPVSVADFPRYGKRSAIFVEDYLNGKFGPANEVGPECASIFYALDRYAASPEIRQWLDDGHIVISNRYVTANMAHQGGKIENRRERKRFIKWEEELEFGIFGIPEPDLTIILHVPAHIAQTLVDRKKQRAYLKGKKRDLHENDLRHLEAAERTYLEIAKMLPNMVLIECVVNGHLLTPEQVHHQIWALVEKVTT